jgi:arsenate reductase (thioredoxin)
VKRILFVCVENANRSQMAEAFARMHGGADVEALSAGSKPGAQVNARAIEAMNERGYDLSEHRPKTLLEVSKGEYDAVVTMGCGDACPWIPAEYREDWAIPDPKNMSAGEFNKVRDDIEQRVKELLKKL